MTLGETIRNLRKSQHLSQEALSDKTGGAVSRSYISEIELDKIGDISAAILVKLAEALKVPEEQLLVAAGLKTAKHPDILKGSMNEEKASFLNFIYNSPYMNMEDKQYIVETINRAYLGIEARMSKEAEKDEKENKDKFRGNPGPAPAS